MANASTPRNFTLKGSPQLLEQLADSIGRALEKAARSTRTPIKYRRKASQVSFEIEVTSKASLAYVPSNIDEIVAIGDGWGAEKRCKNYSKSVALLFDDQYLETRDGGVVCCDC